ncbi:hypothetical protein JTB14_021828 [Gonioctena quinquepunctata]|nr:hypothetical protein JTB14_021828 [Gonioctena quinquepunctata]
MWLVKLGVVPRDIIRIADLRARKTVIWYDTIDEYADFDFLTKRHVSDAFSGYNIVKRGLSSSNDQNVDIGHTIFGKSYTQPGLRAQLMCLILLRSNCEFCGSERSVGVFGCNIKVDKQFVVANIYVGDAKEHAGYASLVQAEIQYLGLTLDMWLQLMSLRWPLDVRMCRVQSMKTFLTM